MINNLANRFAEKLLANGSISDDEQELYIYGFFMLLSSLMYLILACFLGCILGCVLESIVFYIAFQFIRRYAGGYHAATEARCEILTSLSIVTCIIAIKISKVYDFQRVLLIISAVSAVCIFIFCPLDTPEKPLSNKEFKYFRKVSSAILFAIIAVIAVSYFFSFKILFVPCCISLILEAVLISAGKIKKVLNEKKQIS